jgi:hypothetical protein
MKWGQEQVHEYENRSAFGVVWQGILTRFRKAKGAVFYRSPRAVQLAMYPLLERNP